MDATHTPTGQGLPRAALLWAASILAWASVTGVWAQQSAESLEEVIVTGTRIPKSNFVSASPITQVDSDALLYSGTTRVEDLLSQLPQVYTNQNSGISNGSSGTATVNLRNLGDSRTLVLIDGRRMPSGSPFTPGAADINQVPGALIERVEILTGGASAVYGSDAVAGVVNFLLVDDFDGFMLDGQFSQYAHDNADSQLIESLLDEAGYDRPSGTTRDGDTTDLSLLLGRNFDDGRGNLTVYATYREIDAIVQADRMYSACAVGVSISGQPYCGGSLTGEQAVVSDLTRLETEFGLPSYFYMVQGNRFVDWDGSLYNFSPFNYFQRPDERWTAGILGHFDLNSAAQLYGQFMYMDDDSTAQQAPSGSIAAVETLPCGSVLLSEQQFEALCGRYDLGRDERQFATLFRRNAEGGPRRNRLEHRSYRAVLGLRGDLDQGWRFDAYGLYAEVTMDQRYEEELLVSRIERALDAVTDPASGTPVCRSALDGSDPACVPWNVFATGGVTPEAVAYLTETLVSEGGTDQTIVSAYATGDLAHYGLSSPLAGSGLQVVIGAEYRDENIFYDPDYLYGDAAGTIPVDSLRGGFDVTEFYAELNAPLLEDRVLAEALVLEAGYRFSDYSTGETTDTYKLAATWSPIPGLRLRGSVQHATRLPNIEELFSPVTDLRFNLPGGDPCAGSSPARSREACARTGVTGALYGGIPEAPDGFLFNTRIGGNPGLQSESSDTRSVGLVYSPDFVEGLTLTLDWYDIEIEDAVAPTVPGDTLASCLDTGRAAFCDLVQRDPDRGDLWRRSGAGFIDASNQNAGYLRTQGYDLALDWHLEAGGLGSFSLENVLTRVDEWQLQAAPGSPVIECAGQWGGSCITVVPELRNYFRLTWLSPWELNLGLRWRYIDKLEPLLPGDRPLPSYDYFDLSLLWQASETIQLRAGVNNVLDEAPPLALTNEPPTNVNGNTLPGVYDALGQYWFAGFRVRF